ncbi:MAG: trimethylamine methyltransferase family protein [Anaerolineae bacterium]|jgi:trimethylamine:corrinoid methyltransferase-like protein
MAYTRFLTDRSRDAIAAGIYQLLDSTGVQVTEPEAVARLHAAGAQVDGDRVRLPAQMVDDALASAPSELMLYARDGRLPWAIASLWPTVSNTRPSRSWLCR